jgi:hypothetical protein
VSIAVCGGVEGSVEGLTGAHMPCDMLRTSESSLANGTLVITSHVEVSCSRLQKKKNRDEKRQKIADLTGLLTPPDNSVRTL